MVDWVALEVEFLDGIVPVRELARRYGISDMAIRKRAKSLGWVRKSSQEVREAAAANQGTDPDGICVERMKFCGDGDDVIARAMGMSVTDLRSRFADELANGYARRRREVVTLMFEAAEDKSATVIRKLDEIGRAVGAAEAVKSRETPAPKLGKKEEQKIAARNVGGKFSPPSAPKLVVNNE